MKAIAAIRSLTACWEANGVRDCILLRPGFECVQLNDDDKENQHVENLVRFSNDLGKQKTFGDISEGCQQCMRGPSKMEGLKNGWLEERKA